MDLHSAVRSTYPAYFLHCWYTSCLQHILPTSNTAGTLLAFNISYLLLTLLVHFLPSTYPAYF
jgi:hypothetical protein